MHLIIGAFTLICMFVAAPLWRRYKLRRANAKFQHSIWVYDEARRERILAGADPRSILTAEENLIATGFASQVRNIERLPRPDPVIGARSLEATVAPALVKPIKEPLAHLIVPTIPLQRPSAPVPAARMPLPQAPTRPTSPAPESVRSLKPVVTVVPVGLASIRPAAPSLRYEVTYVTEWGEITERRIRLKRAYSQHGEVYVEAHCYLRRDERTFRADRMSDLVEIDTASPIADPVAHFLGFIEPEEIVTPGHELVMAKAKPGLLAMIWVGRAGGDLDADTVAVLSAFCSDRARMNRGAIDFSIKLAERWIADQRPTFETASGSLARIKRGGPEWQMVHDRTRDVASLCDADKRSKRMSRLFRP